MFLCLSSGSSPRYRQDVLRAISMPATSLLQFRYALKYLGGSVQDRIKNNRVISEPALIAYVDQAEASREGQLIPCRVAEVASVTVVGTTVSFRFRLKEFAYAENLNAFNSEAAALSANTIPRRNSEGKVTGCYCIELNAKPKTTVYSQDPSAFEGIVGQLAVHDDFSNEQTFCFVSSITKKHEIVPFNATAAGQLSPNSEYQLNVYQYHPTTTPANASLVVTSTTNFVRFTGYPEVRLDSRYDHKQLSFETERSLDDHFGLLRIEVRQSSTDTLTIDLPIAVKGSLAIGIFYSLVLAFMLASPHIVSALSSTTLSDSTRRLTIAIAGLTSIIAAFIAVFRVRKIL